ncbi:nucleotide exchange factor GrpE [Aliidiomarina sedimenti]|uniref:Protein GrpE n=1 Tax=Aliidiomarina sedimenti TaxID=1933879 RepID=A0ABY0C2U5_9GAMM|nr:nucleotide exchange factor GrpE [Aliidiomarina sedimenti]RUO32187.1 nucleotide exchange factor GrpE [Aliidiomarina sedimenti]
MTKPDNSQSAESQDQQQPQDAAPSSEQQADNQQPNGQADEQSQLQRIGELEAALAAAEGEASARKDAALRAAAEAENVRRRAAQDVQKARDFALEKFAGELLPVVDNLERAMQSMDAEEDAIKVVLEGIDMTYKSFLSTLEKFGVEVVDPQGQPFNPEHHEAMGMQESEEHAPNTVMAVMQKGYTLNGRLLRPAMVMVSRAPTSGVNTTA